MTSLSFIDIFLNAMHFNDDQGLLRQTCNLLCPKFYNNQIRYFIVGGYALIFHGCVRNTMDVDILVHEEDFQKATEIICDAGFSKVVGDGLCARFNHEYFLSIDIFVAPIYGPYPCEKNRINDRGVFFCDLPTLVLTKTQAYVGRPLTEQMLWKKIRDHADLCFLIISHHLGQDFGKKNNFGYFIEGVYEKLYSDYYDKLKKPSNSKKKKKCEIM